MTNPVNLHSREFLDQIALAPFPPGNGLPGILEQLFQESAGQKSATIQSQPEGQNSQVLRI